MSKKRFTNFLTHGICTDKHEPNNTVNDFGSYRCNKDNKTISNLVVDNIL